MNDLPHAQREKEVRTRESGAPPEAPAFAKAPAGGQRRERNRKNVITGLDPVIHGTACANGVMDARVKPAHDSFFSLAYVVQGGQAARRRPCPGGLSGEKAKPSDEAHVRREIPPDEASNPAG